MKMLELMRIMPGQGIGPTNPVLGSQTGVQVQKMNPGLVARQRTTMLIRSGRRGKIRQVALKFDIPKRVANEIVHEILGYQYFLQIGFAICHRRTTLFKESK